MRAKTARNVKFAAVWIVALGLAAFITFLFVLVLLSGFTNFGMSN